MSLDKIAIITKDMEPEKQESKATPAASNITKKYVLIAITVVIVMLIAVGGILGAMTLYHTDVDRMMDVVERHIKTKDVDETIKVDVKNKREEIDAKDVKTGNKLKVIHDFKRSLTVYKLGGQCYVTPLNRSLTPGSPKQLRDELKTNVEADISEKKTSINITVQSVGNEITDRNFLDKSARDACDGLPLYWMKVDPDDDDNALSTNTSDSGSGKSKRSIYHTPPHVCGRLRYPLWRMFSNCRFYCCYKPIYYYVRYYYNGRWYYIRRRIQVCHRLPSRSFYGTRFYGCYRST